MIEDQMFRRENSIRSIIYRSFRLSKKKKTNRASVDVESKIFLIEEEPIDNLVVHHQRPPDDSVKIFGAPPIRAEPCELVKYFPSEGRPFEKDCPLMSFERKRRAHQLFQTGHHANEQLFCPEQASQIELHFQSMVMTDVVIRVCAPNGESSNLLRPPRNSYVVFSPTKVGCGHGVWVVDVAVRDGCRFRSAYRKELYLNGQGILKYHIDPDFHLRQVERLWLGFR